MASSDLCLLRRSSCGKEYFVNDATLTGNDAHSFWPNEFVHNDYAANPVVNSPFQHVTADECAWVHQPLGPSTAERFYPLIGPNNKPVQRMVLSNNYSIQPTVPRDLSSGSLGDSTSFGIGSWVSSDLEFSDLDLNSDVSLDVNLDFSTQFSFSDFGSGSNTAISSYARPSGAIGPDGCLVHDALSSTYVTANSPPESSGSSQPSPPAAPNGHGAKGRRYQCPKCERPFEHKKDLLRHLKTKKHATGFELKYSCRCGKEDSRKDNYLRHVRTCAKRCHPGSRYICKCQLPTADRDAHIEHVRSCRVDLGERGRPAAC